ncbi:hypothetical protein V2I01_36215 [Micromonospora sp. BRA006-A]|nr:hypothetical protein [Micromonospora sp. BRA006-A]
MPTRLPAAPRCCTGSGTAGCGSGPTSPGAPVHLTAANPPSFGVARVGPVHTPPGQRGRGWAKRGRRGQPAAHRRGARVCLFTDQANPVSNRLYARLGFRPVVDMVNLVLVD